MVADISSPPFDPQARERVRRQAVQAQRQAIAPGTSAWVAASAGTGKTKVLVDRVLALLLAGAAPGRILCLTFTKAAAAEMANRLDKALAGWATLPQDRLDAELTALLPEGQLPDRADREHARSLFARVLDVPGGMKIQTIHAFCQSVLGRFPLEARVAPHFRVMDERSAAELLQEARSAVVTGSEAGEGGAIAEALRVLAAHGSETRLSELVGQLLYQRGRLLRGLEILGGTEGLRGCLCRRLGLEGDETREGLLAGACSDEALDMLGMHQAVEALAAGGKTDVARGERIRAWLDDPASRGRRIQDYLAAFFTKGGDGTPLAKSPTKKVLEDNPHVGTVLRHETERLERLRSRLRALESVEKTVALVVLGAAIMRAYEEQKDARALLDYDDLILKTSDLLREEGRAAWVLYKLDGGLDHVLIDEAQDTNPDQWDVVEALTSEFFAGEGREPPANRTSAGRHAEALLRSLFAVGDSKQSIYSFQRADPQGFADRRQRFGRRAQEASMALRDVALEVSFRSTGAVLEAVDSVFAREDARRGLFLDERPLRHHPERVGQAGLVELWPPVYQEDEEEPGAWEPPPAPAGPADGLPARSRLARLIARRIHRWTRDPAGVEDPASWLESRGRRMRPGDVLVLVRQRSPFVEALVRELKTLGVPVAGVDRMVLTEQLAVMDLIALGRVLLLPEDDLTLATVLKGPLFGFDEDQLFSLAHGRRGRLWSALAERARAEPGSPYESAHARLTALMARADYIRPYELYAQLLGAEGGRRDLLARLGPEAADPIEEFLSLALAYERDQVPSLEGFLHWVEAGEQEVKRDLEQGVDLVRVMTVHGAKGLQAPVVILPDTMSLPRDKSGLLWLEQEGNDLSEPPLWPLGGGRDELAAARAKEARKRDDEEEYRRLLYVAMTRAEDRLYVCGHGGKRQEPTGCWYDLIREGLADLAEQVPFDFSGEVEGGWAGPGWRLARPQQAPAEDKARAAEETESREPLPAWARAAAPVDPTPPRPLAPSGPREAEPPATSPLAAGESGPDALARGLLVHRLLQHLPDFPPDSREAAARRLLARSGGALGESGREEVLADVLAVLGDPAAAGLFAAGSRAEVPVIGLVEGARGPVVVSGRVDRLALSESEVLVVDYKANRAPPVEESGVPLAYVRQMASYRAVLKGIFPGRSVRCLLLWTVGPRLMQISDALMDRHAP